MGSPENISILIDGLLRVLLGTLAVATARTRTVSILGLAWLVLALFDFSILWKPEWTTWASMGSYWIFITAMLSISVSSRYGTTAETRAADSA
jgi:hypothetical protein